MAPAESGVGIVLFIQLFQISIKPNDSALKHRYDEDSGDFKFASFLSPVVFLNIFESQGNANPYAGKSFSHRDFSTKQILF